MKVGFYVDGFNLFHAIEAMGDPRLHWTDLSSLATSYLRAGDRLVRTVYFTSLVTWDAAHRQRQVSLLNALEANGVEVIRSRFAKVRRHCMAHDRTCPFREEKQTDVALAVDILADVQSRRVDRVLLVTADSDQVPLARMIENRHPECTVYMIAPPGRLSVARELSSACAGYTELTPGRMRSHPFPDRVLGHDGRLVANRPPAWRIGWHGAADQDS